jgi:hypothetical protein
VLPQRPIFILNAFQGFVYSQNGVLGLLEVFFVRNNPKNRHFGWLKGYLGKKTGWDRRKPYPTLGNLTISLFNVMD